MLKKIRFILVSVIVIFLLGSCANTFETTQMQNYKWEESSEEYKPATFPYERKVDFKITNKKIKFELEDENGEMKEHTIDIISKIETENIESVEKVHIYLGTFDDTFLCKVIFYERNQTIIIFDQKKTKDGNRYESFIIFI